MDFRAIAEAVGIAGDLLGVAIISVGTVAALAWFIVDLYRRPDVNYFQAVRVRVGRAILLGLEVLVAADIIRTVAIEPTFERLGILAGIVLIRTFLSFALEVELTGRWPWQRSKETG